MFRTWAVWRRGGTQRGRGAGLATKEVKFQLQTEGEDPRKGSSEGPFHRSTPQSADTSVPTSPLPESVLRRYGNLPGVLHMIELEKGETGLGLSLAGNRDRSRMSVFVVGIDPGGAAGRDGRMTVGDELLEVRPGKSLPPHRPPPLPLTFASLSQINGQILYGHSHQNASAIIKSSGSKVKVIFIRWVHGRPQMGCSTAAPPAEGAVVAGEQLVMKLSL